MTEMNKQNLSARTRNIYHSKMFFLLFFFINVHKTATANPVNPQQINEIIDAIQNEVCEPEVKKSFEKFLVEKIIRYGDKIIKSLDSDHEKLTVNYREDINEYSRYVSERLDDYKREITNYMDEFRVSLNKDFVTWYKKSNIQDEEIENYRNNQLYNLYTIYNFTMLNAYVKYYDDAKAHDKKAKLDKKQIPVEDIKSNYDTLYAYLRDITDDILKDITTIHAINTENTKTSTKSSNDVKNTTRGNKSINGKQKNNPIKLQGHNKYQNKIITFLLQFKKQNRIMNKTLNDYIKLNEKFITNTNFKLEILLNEIEAENDFYHNYKKHITKNHNSVEDRDHIIDIIYKFNCFYYVVLSYTKVFIHNSEYFIKKHTNSSNTKHADYNIDLEIYTRKMNTLFDYIDYMAKNVLFSDKKHGYIKDGAFYKKGKSISYNKPHNYLYVFGYNPINAKPLKAEEKREAPKPRETEEVLNDKTPKQISRQTADAIIKKYTRQK